MTRRRRFAPTNMRRDERGFTLAELMVSMTLFMIVMALIIPTYVILTDSSTSTAAMTTTDTSIMPILDRLTSQVTNATTIYSPCSSGSYSGTVPCQGGSSATPPSPESGFLVMIEYNSVSAPGTTSSTLMCSQWRVQSGQLQTRSWAASASSYPSFYTATSGLTITNGSSTSGSPGWQPPFAQEAVDGSKAGVLDIDLHIQSSKGGSPQEIETSVAAQGFAATGQVACTAPGNS